MKKIIPADKASSLSRAARILRRGGLVAFPTETVYGLGADASNPRAVARIFEVKKRPSFDPLIVHVASIQEAKRLWKKTPALAEKLMKKFWPGPLTLVLPKSGKVPDIVTAGLPTVAVRCPRHPAALALIRALGRPIAAPSANPFGRTSPTAARAVFEDLGKKIDLILDGGPAAVGVESTVVKIGRGRGTLLRPGGISLEELRKILPVSFKKKKTRGTFESPGLPESHYAPRTPLFLWRGPVAGPPRSPRVGVLSPAVLSPRGDLREVASKLFQTMRELDKMRLDRIVALPVPEKGLGLAIMDRLRRASAGKWMK
ncbi:MAG: threonylcarbamoyl-AMP synthase [Candidatus Omnitrophica bacterium]|nr:threonylcarbamoyl-AMP synthase [Candidatus Omnitrophota bacterium]